MKKIKTYFILLCLLLSQAVLSAQDLRRDVNHMYESYSNLTNFSMDIEVKIYQQKTDNKPIWTMIGAVRRNGENYHSHMDKNDVLVNQDYTVYIDGTKKMIIYRDNKDKWGKKLTHKVYGMEEVSKIIDSMLNKNDSIRYIGTVGSGREYVITNHKGLIQSADMVIDTLSGLVSHLTYYYDAAKMKTNNKAEVDFKNINTDYANNQENYALSQYLTDAKGIKVAAAKYKGYRVFKDTPKGLLGN
jgi:hypothetical protein